MAIHIYKQAIQICTNSLLLKRNNTLFVKWMKTIMFLNGRSLCYFCEYKRIDINILGRNFINSVPDICFSVSDRFSLKSWKWIFHPKHDTTIKTTKNVWMTINVILQHYMEVNISSIDQTSKIHILMDRTFKF